MTNDLVTSARVESPWARALRIGLNRYGSTPIFDQLLAEHSGDSSADKTPLSSRRWHTSHRDQAAREGYGVSTDELVHARNPSRGWNREPPMTTQMSSTTHTTTSKEHHMHTLSNLIERHGIDVEDHLDRDDLVPVHTGPQRQGDVLVLPVAKHGATTDTATTPVPTSGCPVVRGEAGGNTHAIVADGPVYCDTHEASATDLTLALLTVPDGSIAYLAHPEHAYSGIGPGTYTIRRQREQADELRMVQD